jgi:hypothetical protein
MESVPKVYRGQWRSFAVSHSLETVSQRHEAVTEDVTGRIQQLRVQAREWSVNYEDWVQIRTEEYRAIEDEITSRLHNDLKS